MEKKKVIIIGAGPGGLSSAMILSANNYDVEILEKKSEVGGRNASFTLSGYTFDYGPTFFMMKDVLEEVFRMSGRKIEEYMKIVEVDPMYGLFFNKNKVFYPTRDKYRMKKEIERVFPEGSEGYDRYLKNEGKKYDKLIPCLKVPYGKITDFFTKQFITSLPLLDAHVSLFDVLGRYFKEKDLKISFTFQAKYIGMSPWEAPGTFSIISYIEHGGGVYHVMGGLNQLSKGMAKAFQDNGGKISLNKGVKKLIIENKKAIGVELENGEKKYADYIVINADFAHAMTKLVDEEHRKKYTDKKLKSMKYSCSTFMIYLGVDKIYDLPHNGIFFSQDYQQNVNEIVTSKVLSNDPSFYIQNASVIDKSLAPEGKSTIYILVPVPNTTSHIDWEKTKEEFKEKILNLVEERAGLKDIKKHIEVEKIFTPNDWENEKDVYNGATFNLGHNISQMLYWRPHNEFEEFGNCYLVGGGTHPGSGLPTIYESGRISAEIIIKKDKKRNE